MPENVTALLVVAGMFGSAALALWWSARKQRRDDGS